MPVIEWSASAYAVAENAGTVAVCAARSGDLSGTSIVSFANTNGTATEGVDYSGVAGTLIFTRRVTKIVGGGVRGSVSFK